MYTRFALMGNKVPQPLFCVRKEGMHIVQFIEPLLDIPGWIIKQRRGSGSRGHVCVTRESLDDIGFFQSIVERLQKERYGTTA
jgi:hypothetical protein